MIIDAVAANADEVPEPPGSLYIRPTYVGAGADIGAAAHPAPSALLFVLNSPVGDYFKGGIRPLTLHLEKSAPRTVPQFGMVKCAANYAMALGSTMDAMAGNEAVDQVLFATDGDITETGASNFFLGDDERIITRHLDESFLHGVTRDSVIQLARPPRLRRGRALYRPRRAHRMVGAGRSVPVGHRSRSRTSRHHHLLEGKTLTIGDRPARPQHPAPTTSPHRRPDRLCPRHLRLAHPRAKPVADCG